MTYVPPPDMRPAVPDFNDLPTVIRLPHSRKLPYFVLVISSICLMISAFSGVWMPVIWDGISVGNQAIITMFMVIAALGGGTAALRRYASEDEVTIDMEGLKLRTFTWFGIERSSHGWGEFQSIAQTESDGGHQILELLFKGNNHPAVTVFVAKNQSRIKFVNQWIEKRLISG